jgi:hypothetical protein
MPHDHGEPFYRLVEAFCEFLGFRSDTVDVSFIREVAQR